ncbi:MAG: hypothetical protein ACYDDA_03775 [Acidiferrobacteraceae bacterium]
MQVEFVTAELAMLKELVEKASAPGPFARTLASIYDKVTTAHETAVAADKAAAGGKPQ